MLRMCPTSCYALPEHEEVLCVHPERECEHCDAKLCVGGQMWRELTSQAKSAVACP